MTSAELGNTVMHKILDVQMENRIQWGRLVVWSIDTHFDDIVDTLDGLAGMDHDEWRELLEELRDELAAATAHLEHAHSQLSDCRAQAYAQEHSLAITTQHLHVYMMKIRDVLEQKDLLRFELSENFPLDAERLAGLAHQAGEALRAVNAEIDRESDAATLARELELCEQKLADEIARVREKQLPVQAMMSARAQAQALWTLAYRRVGGIFQHALTLANCPAAAELVRPSLSRTSGKARLPSTRLVHQSLNYVPLPLDDRRARV